MSHKNRFLKYAAVLLCSIGALSYGVASSKNVDLGRQEIKVGGVLLTANPVTEHFDTFFLKQSNLSQLNCYAIAYSNGYEIHGKDNYGDTRLSQHITRKTIHNNAYSRDMRDALFVTNTVLQRLIKAGICRKDSKGLKSLDESDSGDDEDEPVKVKEKRENKPKDSLYW